MAEPASKPDSPEKIDLGLAIAGAIQALIVTLIAAVASLGFVAFVGGAVLWARFYSLGLPPTEIVAIVPERSLVATGAAVLTGFGLLGLLAVAVAYLLDGTGSPTVATRLGVAVLATAGLVAVIVSAQEVRPDLADPGDPLRAGIIGAVVLVLSVGIAVIWSHEAPADPAPAPATPSAPAPRLSFLGMLLLIVIWLFRRPSTNTASTGTEANPPRPARPRELKPAGRIAQALVLVGGAIAFWLLYEQWWVVAGFALDVAACYCVLGVARASGDRFAPYGVALFLAVVVFGATLSALRASQTDQVQPVAALRQGEAEPVCGIFITEADDRLYLGRLDVDRQVPGPAEFGNTGNVFWVDRKSVTGWAIGALQSQRDANRALMRLETRVKAERRRTFNLTETTQPDKDGNVGTTLKKVVTNIPLAEPNAPACTIYAA